AGGAGVSLREIWVWPTDGLVANAAVVGFLPGFRVVMLSDCLLESMPRRQILAVMAHELGHVVRRHVAWMIVVLAACYVAAGSVGVVVAEAALDLATLDLAALDLANEGGLLGLLAVARDVGVLVLALWLFGYFSRRFERQADTFAVQLLSARAGREDATPEAVDAMVGALGAVAFLNHVPRARRSWRHGSIIWRQEYLRSIAGRAHAELPIDRFVRVACWTSLALALLGAWLAFAPAP
ncbi:MAG: hypothetical protein EBU70_11745, partial [Actinobacteria bacterium]|nr:hypothetical protein [Actinomycetota bacterium]